MKPRLISLTKRSGRAAGLVVLIALVHSTPLQAQDGERPDVHADFQFGSFPWSGEAFETFSSENVRMLMAAFDKGWSVEKFIKETGADHVETLTLLDRFEDINLIAGPNDYQMRPRLPVIREEDLARVRPVLEMDSAEVVEIIESRWEEIDEFAGTLEAAAGLPAGEVLYQIIVGGVLLGGVVDALYEDQTLMPPPPGRGRRGPGYYAWMIEGDGFVRPLVQQAVPVGRYEVRSVGPVVEENPRIQIEEVARSGPVYESEDARRWRVFTSVFSRDYLLPYIKSRRSGLIELQAEVEASRYTALAELIAWYYNSVAARAADLLVEAGRIRPPDSSYRYALRSPR